MLILDRALGSAFEGIAAFAAGVGPQPISLLRMTTNEVCRKLNDVLSSDMVARAQILQGRVDHEDGVEGAAAHFEDCMPRQNLLCDVGLLLDPPEARVARFTFSSLFGQELKVHSELLAIVRAPHLRGLTNIWERWRYSWAPRHAVKTWGLARVSGLLAGLAAGTLGCLTEIVALSTNAVLVPDRLAREHGILGAIVGLIVLPFVALRHLLRCGLILIDRCATGAYNAACELKYSPEDAHRAQCAYILDPWMSTRHLSRQTLVGVDAELNAFAHVTPDRARVLLDALDLAWNARRLFDTCASRGSQVHVVGEKQVRRLALHVQDEGSRLRLDLSERASAALSSDVAAVHDYCSFTMFCTLLQRARAAHGPHERPRQGRGDRGRWHRFVRDRALRATVEPARTATTAAPSSGGVGPHALHSSPVSPTATGTSSRHSIHTQSLDGSATPGQVELTTTTVLVRSPSCRA